MHICFYHENLQLFIFESPAFNNFIYWASVAAWIIFPGSALTQEPPSSPTEHWKFCKYFYPRALVTQKILQQNSSYCSKLLTLFLRTLSIWNLSVLLFLAIYFLAFSLAMLYEPLYKSKWITKLCLSVHPLTKFYFKGQLCNR